MSPACKKTGESKATIERAARIFMKYEASVGLSDSERETLLAKIVLQILSKSTIGRKSDSDKGGKRRVDRNNPCRIEVTDSALNFFPCKAIRRKPGAREAFQCEKNWRINSRMAETRLARTWERRGSRSSPRVDTFEPLMREGQRG